MELENKIIRTAIPDQIADWLISRINNGEFSPGDRIPSENELAEQLGVSRVSLKIALQKLNTLGITQTRIGDGTYVSDFNMKSYFSELINSNFLDVDLRQLNEFRVMLEYSVMHLAIHKEKVESYIEELESIYEEMRRALTNNDNPEYHMQHFLFHQCICNMSNNQLYMQLYSALSNILFDIYKTNTEKAWTIMDKELSLVHHYEILDSFKRRDIRKCQQVADELLDDPALINP